MAPAGGGALSDEPGGFKSTLSNWAQLARISNLPTTVTNAVVGMAVVGATWEQDWPVMLGVILAIALLYVAGMIFNDVCDVDVDKVERPHRPIPSGRISRAHARSMVITCMFAAIVILAVAGGGGALFTGAILVGLIIAYDTLHHRSAQTIVLMGACRGMVYIVGASAFVWPISDWTVLAAVAGIMTGYTILLSWVARFEVTEDAMPRHCRIVAWVIPVAVLVPALLLIVGRTVNLPMIVLSTLMVTGWLTRSAMLVSDRPPKPVHAVMGWLAGMCLIDMVFLAVLDRPFDAMLAFILFLVTIRSHRRILGS